MYCVTFLGNNVVYECESTTAKCAGDIFVKWKRGRRRKGKRHRECSGYASLQHWWIHLHIRHKVCTPQNPSCKP